MPWAEREKFGIDKNYDKSRESRSRAYSLFEDFMFEQVQTNRLDDDNILIICGSYHVRGLASRFKQAGDDVVTEDTYDANWYRGIPLEVDGGIDGFYKEVHGRDD